MSRGRVARRQRLAVRIYLVSAAALLAVAAALVLIGVAVFRPPRHHGGPFADVARYTAAELAARWGSEEAFANEVTAAAAQLRVAITALRPDGTLLASSARPPLPPPTPEERAALAGTDMIERGHCGPDACQLIFAVQGDDGPAGYLVMESAHRRHEPPPFGEIGFALLLVALGVAAALLGRSLARPLERLAQTAHALGSGDLRARTGIERSDELGAVAHAFDDMADQVEKLVRAQTELVANVAHELRTPLARIRVALDLAESGDPAVARSSLSEIAEDLAELERLVSDVLATSRLDLARTSALGGAPALRLARLEVASVVAESAERLRQRHPDRTLEVDVEPGLPAIDGDGPLLRRALDNLLDNARKYSQGPIRLRAFRRGDGVSVEVVDAGEGIPPEDLPRLGTPFFRGDKSRTRATGGVGLGLSLARRIVEAHGGRLVPASAVGVGTTMTVELPAAPAA